MESLEVVSTVSHINDTKIRIFSSNVACCYTSQYGTSIHWSLALMSMGRINIPTGNLAYTFCTLVKLLGLENFGMIVIFTYFSQSSHIDVSFHIIFINMQKCIYLEALFY